MEVFSTWSDLPIVSPLAGIERTALDVTAGVGLGEITGRTLLHVRGSEAYGARKIGDVGATSIGLLVQLRRDECVLLAPDGQRALSQWSEEIDQAKRRIEPHQIAQITITDITHGRCVLLLVGDEAARVLPKICGLDFSDRQFPDMHAAQTGLAKVRTLIIRADIDAIPAYGLIVDRSLVAYVWNVVFDAAQEFGGVALSEDGLDTLRTATLW